MCVTLIEGYLRLASRAAISYADASSKYNIPAFNEKDRFFVLFTLFLRLQIYEAIAGIFWSIIYFFEKLHKIMLSEFWNKQNIFKNSNS